MPTLKVRSLSVILDTSLSMEAQVMTVTKPIFYHPWLIMQLVPSLSSYGLASKKWSVISGQDYCNLLYAGLPMNLTQKLQLVQNTKEYLLTATSLQFPIQPVLHWLHWLPVVYWIKFKVKP